MSFVDVMTAELRDWFVKFYCQLSKFDKPVCEGQVHSPLSVATPTTGNGMQTECRRLCAYNFPVIKALTTCNSTLNIFNGVHTLKKSTP